MYASGICESKLGRFPSKTFDQTLNDVDFSNGFLHDFSIIDHYLYAEKIDDFNLSVHELTTLQTMGCAIWVLRKNFTYEKGIEEIIRAGYDADTNGACAGAVLGAKWGFGAIPLHLLNYLWYGGILYRDTVPFLKTMGMKFDPPSYEDIQKFK